MKESPTRLKKRSEILDVLFVSTTQFDGGASIAAYRLFCGIRELGLSCKFQSFVRQTDDPDVIGPSEGSTRARIYRFFSKVEQLSIRKYRGALRTPFSAADRRNPFRPRYENVKTRVLHFHWVAKSTLDLRHVPPSTPIIWTLHDAWMFTGGCHYTQDCVRYQESCGKCPQLGSQLATDLSQISWDFKKRTIAAMNLIVVTPSNWLASQARQSLMLKGKEVVVIPNGIDTKIFSPRERLQSCLTLDLDPSLPVILFGAQSVNDRRKGTDLLIDALELLDFKCTALTFGTGILPSIKNDLVQVRNLGPITDENQLPILYSAADVFVCPSREDNLPNTVMEAMSCGTPVVAFDSHGLPDLVDHKKNGYLCRPFDSQELAQGITEILKGLSSYDLGNVARAKVQEIYDLEVVSRQYKKLYERIILMYPQDNPPTYNP
jgi:glycosyltransferase involved in cell wall biosynthesis